MTTITFDEFKSHVESEWRNAEENGVFNDYSPEFLEDEYNPGRVYYTWQHDSFGCVVYDTATSKEQGRAFGKLWMADAGRGMHGFGDTLEGAFADEDEHYRPG